MRVEAVRPLRVLCVLLQSIVSHIVKHLRALEWMFPYILNSIREEHGGGKLEDDTLEAEKSAEMGC